MATVEAAAAAAAAAAVAGGDDGGGGTLDEGSRRSVRCRRPSQYDSSKAIEHGDFVWVCHSRGGWRRWPARYHDNRTSVGSGNKVAVAQFFVDGSYLPITTGVDVELVAGVTPGVNVEIMDANIANERAKQFNRRDLFLADNAVQRQQSKGEALVMTSCDARWEEGLLNMHRVLSGITVEHMADPHAVATLDDNDNDNDDEFDSAKTVSSSCSATTKEHTAASPKHKNSLASNGKSKPHKVLRAKAKARAKVKPPPSSPSPSSHIAGPKSKWRPLEHLRLENGILDRWTHNVRYLTRDVGTTRDAASVKLYVKHAVTSRAAGASTGYPWTAVTMVDIPCGKHVAGMRLSTLSVGVGAFDTVLQVKRRLACVVQRDAFGGEVEVRPCWLNLYGEGVEGEAGVGLRDDAAVVGSVRRDDLRWQFHQRLRVQVHDDGRRKSCRKCKSTLKEGSVICAKKTLSSMNGRCRWDDAKNGWMHTACWRQGRSTSSTAQRVEYHTNVPTAARVQFEREAKAEVDRAGKSTHLLRIDPDPTLTGGADSDEDGAGGAHLHALGEEVRAAFRQDMRVAGVVSAVGEKGRGKKTLLPSGNEFQASPPGPGLYTCSFGCGFHGTYGETAAHERRCPSAEVLSIRVITRDVEDDAAKSSRAAAAKDLPSPYPGESALRLTPGRRKRYSCHCVSVRRSVVDNGAGNGNGHGSGSAMSLATHLCADCTCGAKVKPCRHAVFVVVRAFLHPRASAGNLRRENDALLTFVDLCDPGSFIRMGGKLSPRHVGIVQSSHCKFNVHLSLCAFGPTECFICHGSMVGKRVAACRNMHQCCLDCFQTEYAQDRLPCPFCTGDNVEGFRTPPAPFNGIDPSTRNVLTPSRRVLLRAQLSAHFRKRLSATPKPNLPAPTAAAVSAAYGGGGDGGGSGGGSLLRLVLNDAETERLRVATSSGKRRSVDVTPPAAPAPNGGFARGSPVAGALVACTSPPSPAVPSIPRVANGSLTPPTAQAEQPHVPCAVGSKRCRQEDDGGGEAVPTAKRFAAPLPTPPPRT